MTSKTSSAPLPPLSEADIAEYLINTPEFFQRHAEVLGSITIASPHGARAVSLHERQTELLREKIKGLEQRVMDMVRHGNENAAIAQKIHEWACTLARAIDPRVLARMNESQHHRGPDEGGTHVAPGKDGWQRFRLNRGHGEVTQLVEVLNLAGGKLCQGSKSSHGKVL